MGGGGFTMEPDNPALDDYVRPRPGARAADLPAAHRGRRLGGPDPPVLRGVRRPATASRRTSRCSASGRNPVPLREHLLAQDAIYVGGGSLINLIAIWRAQGLDEILREAWRAGSSSPG